MKFVKRTGFWDGHDSLVPGYANLNFNGSPGPDIFNGGADNDTAVGNNGNDTLSGNDGNDLLVGNAGADTLDGGAGRDTLYGGDESPPFSYPYYGNSVTPPLLDTGTEVDTLIGGAGDDAIFAGYGDNVDGGSHESYGDLLLISFLGAPTGVTVDFTLASQTIGGGTITGIENIGWVQGSNFDDDINVAAPSNGYSPFGAIYGMDGNDRLRAGYYTGTMFGGNGNDTVDGRGSQYLQAVDGGDGDDILYTNTNTFAAAYGGAGNDTIYSHGTTSGGSGNDLIIVQFSYYGGRVVGDEGDDDIRASYAGNFLGGGDGADRLTGDSGSDLLVSGNFVGATATPDYDMALDHDVLAGFGGADVLCAGYGDDVDGGSGADTLRYSLGGLAGGVVFSTEVFGAAQPFSLAGGLINNIEALTHLRGTNFADTLILATQAQLLNVDAGDGDDVIISNGSSVSALGGAGNDRFISGIAGDVFDGGAGTDTADFSGYAAAVTVQLALPGGGAGSGPGGDQFTNVENVDGSAFGDTLSGSDDANLLQGLDGEDLLKGLGGNDTLIGGNGIDTMDGGLGDDTIYVDQSGDVVAEGAGQGFDAVYASISYILTAGAEVEWLSAATTTAAVALDLTGNAVGQYLIGNAGNNILDGAGGADVMIGYGGNDTYRIDNGGDAVLEAAGGGNDRIETTVSYYLTAGVDAETLAAADAGALSDIRLTGNELGQALFGNEGFNQLNGAGGADVMTGYGGSDSYYVDDLDDVVAEAANQGFDALYSAVSYTLAAGVSVEWFSTIDNFATNALNLTGNSLAQYMIGNAGANILSGGGGADLMYGLGGNDIYIIDFAGAVPMELGDNGFDTVRTSVTYLLSSGLSIERMETDNAAGFAGIDLIGNELGQELIGNAGANSLDGNGGADVLRGLGGNDSYLVDNAGDQVFEAAAAGFDAVYSSISYTLAAGAEVEWLAASSSGGTGALNLTGNAFDNYVLGNAGANILDGGAGADILYGYGGADSFAFTTALGGNNVDFIVDFVAGTDKIALDDAIFTAIGAPGALAAAAFVTGTAAADADDRIVYNSATGQLFYDADGNGAGGAVLFATLQGNPALTASDFQVI